MDAPHDPDTVVWTRTQPGQPPARPEWAQGPDRGTRDPGWQDRDPGWPRDSGWQEPGAQRPGPQPGPSGDQDTPDEPSGAPAGKKRKHFWRELLIIILVAAA